MSYATLLINCCTVLEDTGAVPDSYGNLTPAWTPVAGYEDIPCRLMSTGGTEIKIGAEVVIAYDKLFLGNIVITEQNRVSVYAGTVDAWVDYEILLVHDRQDGADSHHKECDLQVVR